MSLIHWQTNDYNKWIVEGCPINNTVTHLRFDSSPTGACHSLNDIPIYNLTNLNSVYVNGHQYKLQNKLQKTMHELLPFNLVKSLTNLQELHIPNNNLSYLPDIKYLINLKILRCNCNHILSLEGIENLINLEEISCYNNGLTSLKDVKKLINLKYLWCHNNKITSLEGIENLINLKVLRCNHNKIISLEKIKNLAKLQELYCHHNKITSLESIEKLQFLNKIMWHNNLITHVSPKILEKLKIIQSSDYLTEYEKQKYKDLHSNIISLMNTIKSTEEIKQNVNNINIAILGPVSAGKSTFFNSLFTQTCSEMKRKKTTMLPQIYKTTFDEDHIDSIEKIYNKNKASNEEILTKRENGTFNYQTDFKEIIHSVGFINDFINLPDENATYSILDMPGLNCGGDEFYYDYIRQNSKKIDIYVLVFDINSGLNTSDEIKILELIVSQIKTNSNGYLHILLNKCDEIEYNDNNEPYLLDDELQELFVRSQEIIKSKCADVISKVFVSPICASKLYVFRGVKNNISMIDEKHLDMIIKETSGNIELKKMKNDIDKKRTYIKGLLAEKNKNKHNELFDSWMCDTGYRIFLNNLKTILVHYNEFIYYHINSELEILISYIYNHQTNEIEFFENVEKTLDTINLQIKNVLKIRDCHWKIPQTILNNIQLIDDIIKYKCESKINVLNSFSDVPTIKKIVDLFCEYITIICDYLPKNKDPLKSYEFIKEKENLLLITEFKKHFDDKIFVEIKDVISKEDLLVSIKTTLETDVFNILHIYETVKKYKNSCVFSSHTNTYTNIYEELKKCFFDTLNNKEIILKQQKGNNVGDQICVITTYFENFKNCFDIFVDIDNQFDKNIDIIIKMLSSFLFCDISYAHVLINWINLNQCKIDGTFNKLKYFYFCLNHTITSEIIKINTPHFLCEMAVFYYINIKLDELFAKLHNFKFKSNIDDTSCDSKHDLNFDPNSKISKNHNKSDNSDDSDGSNDSNDSDNSNNSEKCVYTIAKKNASKYTRKILKSGKVH